MRALGEDRNLADLAPVVLYRTLGPSLPDGAAAAAILWPVTLGYAMRDPESLRRAGYDGDPLAQADALFDAILTGRSGVIFSSDDWEASWQRLGNEGRIRLVMPEMLAELGALEAGPEPVSEEFPLVLMAGERRDYSANTIFRDQAWRRKDAEGALRLSPQDARRLGIDDGGRAKITTRRGSALARVEVTERMQPGHVSLPNGFGLDNTDGSRSGVALNELTSLEDKDRFAGTPHHKLVPARVEAVG